MDLTPIFATAIPEANRRQTATLGDRGSYIGSSDLGCARKAYLQRESPKQHDINSILRMMRGHAAEFMLEKFFKVSGVPYDTQVEVTHPQMPLKAHIDFLLYEPDRLHVVEVKSMSGIPDAPYLNHEDQLHFQMGMLKIQYPKAKIGGSILAVDLNAGQVHQFNGYEHDDATFNYLYCKALHLLDVMNGMEEARCSPSQLCSYCQYRSDCPAMTLPKVELPPEIEMLAGKYAELNSMKSHAEKELKALRQELVDFTGPAFKGRSDNYDLVVSSVAPSMTVDASILKKDYPDVYPMVLKERAGYTKLEVKPVKKAA